MAVASAKKAGNGKPGAKHNIEAMREAYYERISKYDMAPLWKVMSSVVTKEPLTHCVPALWRFQDAKSFVLESGPLITAEEAERRVLILENPAMRGQSKITNSLFAGIQMILPGEVAPAHRHVSSAVRFVLDGVDFPMVNFFETSFAEQFAEKTQPTGRGDGDSLAFYGSGVLPDSIPARAGSTPVINYTYARTRPIVERMKKAGDIDKRHGARVRYVNPVTGGPVLPTMGASLALLPAGFKGEPYRSTDGTVFVCVEGKGTTKVGDKTLEWSPNDVFVVPPWMRYSHQAAKESVLFSISDRPAQEALGIWREGN